MTDQIFDARPTAASVAQKPGRLIRLVAYRQRAGRLARRVRGFAARWLNAVAWRRARLFSAPAPRYQGYIDERSVDHVAGWLRDLADPGLRLVFEVVLPGTDRQRILHRGVADRFSPVLHAVGVGKGDYAFHVRFTPSLSATERDALLIRPAGSAWRLELAPDLRTTLADSVFPVAPIPANGTAILPAASHRWRRALAWRKPRISTTPLPHFQGYIDERSIDHVAGWVRDLADPERRLVFEVVLPGIGPERILHRGVADRFSPILRAVGVGKGDYAFHIRFSSPISAAERDTLFVRPAGSAWRLELAPELRTNLADSVFPVPSVPADGPGAPDSVPGPPASVPVAAGHLISHVAMDLVNNCNLRCPFCLSDHRNVHRTNMMSEETYRAALRLIPYVSPGNFWLSCGQEPTLHPRLLDFIAMVPDVYRQKLMFTSNLAKPMPRDYFAALAESGMHHINVSLESLDPALYERLRKGARYRIFKANWDTMLECFAAGSRPPRIRYIIMAYRSNLAELPGLVETLLAERMAWQVEARYTYDSIFIPHEFREAEFLTTEEWAWLAGQLAHHDPARVVLTAPPGGIGYQSAGNAAPVVQADPQPAVQVDPQPAESQPAITVPSSRFTRIDRPLNMIIEWTGATTIYGWEESDASPEPIRATYLVSNIRYISDPLQFINGL